MARGRSATTRSTSTPISRACTSKRPNRPTQGSLKLMSDRPYSKMIKEKLILRDYLAADRTVLANERTFLAYVRTALTLFAAGATSIHFFQSLVIQIAGWILMPLGVITLIIGLTRYKKMQRQIRDEMEEGNPPTPNTE
ncbi:MAG: DUF202 domain-containing protein [candidate division NC10 bacterium]